MRRDDARNALRHPDSGVLERGDLLGIVRQQAHALDLEIAQNLGGHAIVAQVGLETQAFVGFHRVGAAVLQFVGPQFVQQADAAPLLVLVNQQPAAFFGDQVQRQLQLRPAIAPQTVEHVAGQALRVDADQRRLAPRGHLAHPQDHALLHLTFPRLGVIGSFEAINAEMAESAGEIGFGDFAKHGCAEWRTGCIHYNDPQAPHGTPTTVDPAAAGGGGGVAGEHPFAL